MIDILITKTVKVKIINFNVELYREKGYNCKIGDEIDVKIEDVSHHNKQQIELLCDECKTNKKLISVTSLYNQKCYEGGKYICPQCYKKILDSRKCEVCGSTHGTTLYLGKRYLCQKHKAQVRDYGRVKRTTKDPNEIRIYDTYAEFDTYNIEGEVNGTFKINLDIVDFVKTHKMYKHKDGYACYKFKDKNNKTKNMRLHRYVMRVHDKNDNETVVDHIDRDKSNNLRSNLRLVEYLDNIVNTGILCTNTSGHKGISWDKRSGKWEAYIHQHNKKISLGIYTDFDKAVEVREIAEVIYFGEKNPNYETLINKYIDNSKVKKYLLQKSNNKY